MFWYQSYAKLIKKWKILSIHSVSRIWGILALKLLRPSTFFVRKNFNFGVYSLTTYRTNQTFFSLSQSVLLVFSSKFINFNCFQFDWEKVVHNIICMCQYIISNVLYLFFQPWQIFVNVIGLLKKLNKAINYYEVNNRISHIKYRLRNISRMLPAVHISSHMPLPHFTPRRLDYFGF